MPSSRSPDPASPVIRRKITTPPSPERLVVRERIDRLVGDLVQRGVSGGALYDGLVALTAASGYVAGSVVGFIWNRFGSRQAHA